MIKKLILALIMLLLVCYGYSQEYPTVTLEMRNVKLIAVLKQLERQSAYSFVYNETVNLNQEKSVSIQNLQLLDALEIIFQETDITWKIDKKYIILFPQKPEASIKKVTISGYITDSESSEVLIGANVYDWISGSGTATNEFGFYSLTLPAGEIDLQFSYTGYEPEKKKIDLQENERINIRLATHMMLDEVVILGDRAETGISATQMGALDVPLDILKNTPSLLGEADVMKTIQMLPGVQSGTEGGAGVYVRGGGPEENLVLLDGIPLYNVDHVFGFFSVFTPEAVKKVSLFKSSFPARFGGRLSSVIDVRTNDGDMHHYHGAAGIGLLSAKFQLEGPIRKGRTSFNISGRRSYLDLMSKPLFGKGDDFGYFFYDLNAKLNHKFNDKSRLFLSFYNGKDKFHSKFSESDGIFKSKDEATLNWGNKLLAVRWNYIFSPKLFSNTTVAFTEYRFGIKTEWLNYNSEKGLDYKLNSQYRSGIKDWAYKIDFDYYPLPKHHVKFGTNYLYHDFKPEVESSRIRDNEKGHMKDTIYTHLSDSHIYAHEVSIYAEDNFDVTSRLSVNAGIHFSLFRVKNTTYTSAQPRLSARYQLTDDIALKASYTKMNQYIHLLSSYTITMPTDLWVPVTERIKPMRSHQYSIGGYYTGIQGWEFSTEVYYKNMRNVLEYKDGATFLGSSYNWEEKVEMGRGRAYGIELMAQKTIGKTTGWLAYTLAKSERRFGKNGINQGEWFPYRYDRRHLINLMVNHTFSDRIDVGASWEFYTGGATTLGEETTLIISPTDAPGFGYYYGYWGQYNGPVFEGVDYVDKRNNYRMPPSHRLNIGINFRKKKKHGERIWNFSIYNIYNAMNPTFINRVNDTSVRKITIFPIIPSFTYTYKF
ncbi:MAG: TonB-dependent receptor [Tannerella sp.]|jgi:outer membrane receptor for ferrienterochelin and colicin|nr:TonB-dependent receptor [Tannerella sp.]